MTSLASWIENPPEFGGLETIPENTFVMLWWSNIWIGVKLSCEKRQVVTLWAQLIQEELEILDNGFNVEYLRWSNICHMILATTKTKHQDWYFPWLHKGTLYFRNWDLKFLHIYEKFILSFSFRWVEFWLIT